MNTFGVRGLLSRHIASYAYSWFQLFDPSGNGATFARGNGSAGGDYQAYDGFGGRTSTGTYTASDPFAGHGGQFGYYSDWETGLTLCGHRYYDSANGRWLTKDPIGTAGGVNVYAYCGNNGVMRSDPSGNFALALPALMPFLPALGPIGWGLAFGAAGAFLLYEGYQAYKAYKEYQRSSRYEEEEGGYEEDEPSSGSKGNTRGGKSGNCERMGRSANKGQNGSDTGKIKKAAGRDITGSTALTGEMRSSLRDQITTYCGATTLLRWRVNIFRKQLQRLKEQWEAIGI